MRYNQALLDAVDRNNLPGVKTALDHGANVNAHNIDGWTAIMDASSTDVARLLLDHGADVNARSKDGKTALFFARQFNHPAIVDLPVNAGAEE